LRTTGDSAAEVGPGLAHRAVAQSLGVSVGTVWTTVLRARAAGLGWPQVQPFMDAALEARLHGPKVAPGATRSLPDFAHLHTERRILSQPPYPERWRLSVMTCQHHSGQPGLGCPAQAVRHRAPGDPTTLGNLAVTLAARPLQAEDLPRCTHG
jgi:hypothetical protein